MDPNELYACVSARSVWKNSTTLSSRQAVNLAACPALTFGNSALAYQAAIDGSGIAIAHRPLVRDDLSSGRLVAASEIRVATGETYYLGGRDTHDASPSATAFRT